MTILDVANNKTHAGTRENILPLLDQREFRDALSRDGEIDPEVFRKRFLGNNNVGRNAQVSRKLFDKMKEDNVYKLHQLDKLKKASKTLDVKGDPSCMGIGSLFLIPSSSYLDQLNDLSLNKEELRLQSEEDEKQQAIEAVTSFHGFNEAIMQLNNFSNCPGFEWTEIERESEDSHSSEDVICLKDNVKDRDKETQALIKSKRSLATTLLQQRQTELRDIAKDHTTSDYLLKVAFLQDIIKKVKRHLQSDQQGCKHPYHGLAEHALVSKQKATASSLKTITFPSKKSDKLTCYLEETGEAKFGKECYTQRYDCMDQRQQENFKKIKKDFIFEDPNQNDWMIKFPVYDNASTRWVEDYSFERGNYYEISNVDEATAVFQTKQVVSRGRHRLTSKVSQSPIYFMKNTDGKYEELNLDNNERIRDKGFKKPRYPFFRPTDQCSVARQEAGGVCFQEACRQHDLCFQTLPKPGGDNLDGHFKKCNSDFKKNIEKLCEANQKNSITGWINNKSCQTWKHLFYAGVQWGEAVTEQHKGFSFNQSQIDQAEYLNVLYIDLRDTLCVDNNNNLNCQKILTLSDKLRVFRAKHALDQTNAKDVKRK
ncbi:MAG: hypothetical protein ISR65_07595 [Bacteriovoracaceae bacterium]|nr:hypothetical protein [Bacteriovoracaceae bacterium]